ncbi:TPA: hypothetical protein ACGOYW_001750 [Streptococcus suis]
MKRFIIDAETDGLYGPLLTIAVLVTNSKGEVLESFYGGLPAHIAVASDPWVVDNVLPFISEYQAFDSEEALLEKVWSLWSDHREDSLCFADVPHPIESRIFSKMVTDHQEERYYQGPFPLIDIASILLGKGYSPLVDRESLVRDFQGHRHNALDDVRLSNHLLTYLFHEEADV